MDVDKDDIDFSKYLMATIRLPVRITREGNLMALHDYADIVVGEMIGIPTKTSTSVYSTVVKYAEEHPSYLEKIVLEEDLQERTCSSSEPLSSEPLSNESPIIKDEKFAVELHEFPFLRRRQKPKNMTFRLRHRASNFTKKAYCQ
jgi:hypothetical protein